jgi:hypothetical protein
MRIEEMRSGRAYLGKRVHRGGIGGFETHDVGRVLPQAPAEERAEPGPVIPQSDLEKSQWSVVSFDGIEAGGLTYDQATRLMTVLGESGIHGLCIITDIAALNVD